MVFEHPLQLFLQQQPGPPFQRIQAQIQQLQSGPRVISPPTVNNQAVLEQQQQQQQQLLQHQQQQLQQQQAARMISPPSSSRTGKKIVLIEPFTGSCYHLSIHMSGYEVYLCVI